VRETSVEKRLAKEIKALGGFSIKIMPVVAGVPDRLILLPQGRFFLVETKAPGGSLRPVQKVWHSRAAKIGIDVVVLSSIEEVVQWVRDLNT
jgi:hypothetical protein